jgi:AGCS family alanine or glycine:cation symporter
MENMYGILEDIGGVLWGIWTFWGLLFAGLLFTVWTRFTQYTALTHGVAVVRGKYDSPDDPGAINHFQALSAALSATIGLGNIGGVALAIGIGGPGALFWMWVVGFFGMALKTAEITLAMLYRNTDDPENPHGGAMWVVEKAIGEKGDEWKMLARFIGVFFCVTLIISTFTGGNMFQAWSVATLTEGYFEVPRIVTGILIAVIVGMVVIGGIKRIGEVAGKLVPLMCVIYLLSALAVLAMNVTELPGLLLLVVKSAFSPAEATGAFVGGSIYFAFSQGMKRALFSNEAGQGSAPIAHAAAKTNEPAREGIVGGMGPFIDTICICTITALVILSTNTWNREAIGPFGSPVTIEEGVVKASTDVSDLPEMAEQMGEWGDGSSFYLIGRTEGATHVDTESSLVKVTGKVVALPNDNPEAPVELKIEWDQVELGVEDWIGTPSAVTVTDLGVHRSYDGALLTGHAFDRQFPGLGKWLVTLAAWLFAISTMISWCYYGEQGMVYMLGEKSVLYYKMVFLAGAIFAATAINDTSHMLILIDLGTGAMLWANMPIVLGLGYLAIRSLNDYNRRLKAGEFNNDKGEAQ